MRKFGCIVIITLAACSHGLSLKECSKDKECSAALDTLYASNRVAAAACPVKVDESNPACDAAMAAIDQAESNVFPRLNKEDGLGLITSLMAERLEEQR